MVEQAVLISGWIINFCSWGAIGLMYLKMRRERNQVTALRLLLDVLQAMRENKRVLKGEK